MQVEIDDGSSLRLDVTIIIPKGVIEFADLPYIISESKRARHHTPERCWAMEEGICAKTY